MLKMTLLCVASLAVGAGLGWQLHGDDEPFALGALAGTPATQPGTSRPVFVNPGSTLDIEQIRVVLREELAVLARNGAGQPRAAVIQPPATPELVAKRQAAAEEIETMIRGGNWGNEQRTAFHQRIGLLDAEQGARLLREVTIALNDGTLQMSTNGPPL